MGTPLFFFLHPKSATPNIGGTFCSPCKYCTMLLAIAVTLICVEIKNRVMNRAFTDVATKFWNIWELRVGVVLSLILQIFLFITARIRARYNGKGMPLIAISVWIVYLLADWIATLVLSTLLRGYIELENDLVVFWSPFLLWHLGSPDNITAFSLADNELWLRHFLALVLQVAEAVYICVRYRSDTALNFMAAPIFLAGLFKYGEKIWALRSASDKQIISSLYSYRAPRGWEKMILTESSVSTKEDQSKTRGSSVAILRKAYSSFIRFKPLFSDVPYWIPAKVHDRMISILGEVEDEEEAFKLVGVELRILYDMLFTKMSVLHSHSKGILCLRGLCCLSAVSCLIAFTAIIDKNKHKAVDVAVTYFLLVGAIFLDICSFLDHAFSIWGMIWLSNNVQGNWLYKLYSKVAASRSHSIPSKMVIKSMAQHDIIAYCVKAWTSKFTSTIRLIDTGNLVQKFGNTQWKHVDHELKRFIYQHLKEKHKKCKDAAFKLEDISKLLDEKGGNVLKEKSSTIQPEDLNWDRPDFIRQIFLWHIATELVYYNDLDKHRGSVSSVSCKISKCLSDYMMYLAMVRPSMLPKGLNEVISDETYKEAKNLFPEQMREDERDIRKAFTNGLINYTNADMATSRLMLDDIDEIATSRKEEALIDGCKIAQKLKNLVSEERWDDEEKWGLIAEVWMELMTYCASQCTWKEHAEQLRHGGELLTHVSLLMAHLGLTTKIYRYKPAYE